MSVNLRYGTAPDGADAWEHRRNLLLGTIRRFDPDLLGAQECLEEQAAFLRDSLIGFDFVGVGRDDGRRAGEMCALFFRSGRLRKLDEGHFWLSETPGIPGSRSWDSALTRIASWVRLQSRSDSSLTFLFLNTHFDHRGETARRRSGELVAGWLRAHHAGARIVVTGDFNAPAAPDRDGPYRTLTGCAPAGGPMLLDAFRVRHAPAPGEGTYHGFTGRTDGDRIDWILLSGELVPLSAEIVRTHDGIRYPSDHFPVTAIARVLGPRPDRAGTSPGSDPTGPARFEGEIARFEGGDRAGMPPPGGILFVGSSSIRMWDSLEADFSGLPVINRGFGGSEYTDLLTCAERIVFPLHARWIVLYEGDNDLEAGTPPLGVLAGFRAFVDWARARLPGTRIAVLSIKPSPARWRLEPEVRAANAMIRACCEADSNLVFVDIFTPMLDANGAPRPDLFLEDGLHLNGAGYSIWKDRLAFLYESPGGGER